MARQPSKPTAEALSLDHQTIAADIAAFRKRGGRIEVMGNTPMRNTGSPFRSREEERKAPTPVSRSRRAAAKA